LSKKELLKQTGIKGIEIMKQAVGRVVNTSSSITVSVYPTELQSSTLRLKEGYIKKWVNIVSGFKQRYFVLTRDLLIYYKEKKGHVSEKGQISIKLARVDPRTMNDRKMIIGTGTNEIHLEFQTIEEKR
jgi:hypothetical protein